MSRFLCALGALCVSNLPATTLTVDGAGASAERFATIRDALVDLGASGLGSDSFPDEIQITAEELTEQTGFVINGGFDEAGEYTPVQDDLMIRATALCEVSVSAANGVFNDNERISIYLADNQEVSLRNLVLFPTPSPDEVHEEFISVEEADHTSRLIHGALDLQNVTITSRGSPVVDPGEVLSVHDNPSFSTVTYNFTDVVIENHLANALNIRCDSAVVQMTDCRIENNGPPDSGTANTRAGIRISPDRDAVVDLNRVISRGNTGHGVLIPRWASSVSIGPGCRFEGNTRNGAVITAFRRIDMIATPEDPILLHANGSAGLAANLDEGSRLLCRDVIMCGNGHAGAVIRGASGTLTEPGANFQHCLFASNSTGDDQSNVSFVTVDEESPVVIFEDCTLHDVAATSGPQSPPPSQIEAAFANHDLEVIMRNCVMSGTSDEYAFNFIFGSGAKAANLSDCAVVFEGPHALGALRVGGEGIVNLNNVLSVDPQYLNTACPPDANSFDIQSSIYSQAGPGGAPLTGWGDFVGNFWSGQGLTWH